MQTAFTPDVESVLTLTRNLVETQGRLFDIAYAIGRYDNEQELCLGAFRFNPRTLYATLRPLVHERGVHYITLGRIRALDVRPARELTIAHIGGTTYAEHRARIAMFERSTPPCIGPLDALSPASIPPLYACLQPLLERV